MKEKEYNEFVQALINAMETCVQKHIPDIDGEENDLRSALDQALNVIADRYSL